VDFSSPANKLQIAHSAGGAWCTSSDGSVCSSSGALVARNPGSTRPDLMVQMENGIGGSTHLEYRPSTQWDNTDAGGTPHLPYLIWTLTRIERDDGMCGASNNPACAAGSGSHELSTDI